MRRTERWTNEQIYPLLVWWSSIKLVGLISPNTASRNTPCDDPAMTRWSLRWAQQVLFSPKTVRSRLAEPSMSPASSQLLDVVTTSFLIWNCLVSNLPRSVTGRCRSQATLLALKPSVSGMLADYLWPVVGIFFSLQDSSVSELARFFI